MSGPIPADQKHVVVVELPGPVDAAKYDAFRAALDALVRDHGVQISIHARGKKVGAGGPSPAK